jgi:hypothetical protein
MSAHNELDIHVPEASARTLGLEVTRALEGILDIIAMSEISGAQKERITTLYRNHNEALAKLTEKARACEAHSTR